MPISRLTALVVLFLAAAAPLAAQTACPSLMLWAGRDLSALDAATARRALQIMAQDGVLNPEVHDEAACAAALDTLRQEGLLIRPPDLTARHGIPPDCTGLGAALPALIATMTAAQHAMLRAGAWRVDPGAIPRRPAACAFVHGTLQRIGVLDSAPIGCAALLNWARRVQTTLAPEDRTVVSRALAGVIEPGPYRRPPEDLCARAADHVSRAGVDLSALGLRAVQGVAPDCASVLAAVAQGYGNLTSAQRFSLGAALSGVSLSLDGGSDDPVACAILHGALEAQGLLSALRP